MISISSKNIKEIAKAVREGKVLVCPTDTVYGLLADATNEKAVKRIFKIKRRQKGKSIPIFVRDIRMAKKLAFVNKRQEKFLKKVWPGKVTVVLKRKMNSGLLKILFSRKKTIGLRIPDYKLVNILLKEINRPLTGTSANVSGKPPSTKIKEVLKQLKNQKNQPDLVIDAGNLPESRPSKVIDIMGDKYKVIRY